MGGGVPENITDGDPSTGPSSSGGNVVEDSESSSSDAGSELSVTGQGAATLDDGGGGGGSGDPSPDGPGGTRPGDVITSPDELGDDSDSTTSPTDDTANDGGGGGGGGGGDPSPDGPGGTRPEDVFTSPDELGDSSTPNDGDSTTSPTDGTTDGGGDGSDSGGDELVAEPKDPQPMPADERPEPKRETEPEPALEGTPGDEFGLEGNSASQYQSQAKELETQIVESNEFVTRDDIQIELAGDKLVPRYSGEAEATQRRIQERAAADRLGVEPGDIDVTGEGVVAETERGETVLQMETVASNIDEQFPENTGYSIGESTEDGYRVEVDTPSGSETTTVAFDEDAAQQLQEQSIARELGVDATDINVENGSAVGTTDAGEQALEASVEEDVLADRPGLSEDDIDVSWDDGQPTVSFSDEYYQDRQETVDARVQGLTNSPGPGAEQAMDQQALEAGAEQLSEQTGLDVSADEVTLEQTDSGTVVRFDEDARQVIQDGFSEDTTTQVSAADLNDISGSTSVQSPTVDVGSESGDSGAGDGIDYTSGGLVTGGADQFVGALNRNYNRILGDTVETAVPSGTPGEDVVEAFGKGASQAVNPGAYLQGAETVAEVSSNAADATLSGQGGQVAEDAVNFGSRTADRAISDLQENPAETTASFTGGLFGGYAAGTAVTRVTPGLDAPKGDLPTRLQAEIDPRNSLTATAGRKAVEKAKSGTSSVLNRGLPSDERAMANPLQIGKSDSDRSSGGDSTGDSESDGVRGIQMEDDGGSMLPDQIQGALDAFRRGDIIRRADARGRERALDNQDDVPEQEQSDTSYAPSTPGGSGWQRTNTGPGGDYVASGGPDTSRSGPSQSQMQAWMGSTGSARSSSRASDQSDTTGGTEEARPTPLSEIRTQAEDVLGGAQAVGSGAALSRAGAGASVLDLTGGVPGREATTPEQPTSRTSPDANSAVFGTTALGTRIGTETSTETRTEIGTGTGNRIGLFDGTTTAPSTITGTENDILDETTTRPVSTVDSPAKPQTPNETTTRSTPNPNPNSPPNILTPGTPDDGNPPGTETPPETDTPPNPLTPGDPDKPRDPDLPDLPGLDAQRGGDASLLGTRSKTYEFEFKNPLGGF